MRKRIVVIGAGVSGLVCARLLAARHDVTLLEAASRLGGHAHTVECDVGARPVAADVGFMVFNRRTYPNFTRLLDLLGVRSQPADMSFSVRADHAGLEYQSGDLFAQRRNLASPGFWRMLADILRFNRAARSVAAGPTANGADTLPLMATIRDFLWQANFGRQLWEHYLLPMTAAIWSSPPRQVENFPARFLLGFLANHGLLQLRDRPQWLTIPGGSRTYVAALAAPLGERVRLGCPVRRVERVDDGVVVDAANQPPQQFDAAILATHAPQSLAMLTDATLAERRTLGAFAYQSNDAVLHADATVLPRRRRAWASWNFLATDDPARPPAVTYDLNLLQQLRLPAPLCVTLNPPVPLRDDAVLAPLQFEHPLYSTASVAAQSQREELHRDGRVFFAGAYWGYGFHEDGVNSALAVCKHFGASLDDLATSPR